MVKKSFDVSNFDYIDNRFSNLVEALYSQDFLVIERERGRERDFRFFLHFIFV